MQPSDDELLFLVCVADLLMMGYNLPELGRGTMCSRIGVVETAV